MHLTRMILRAPILIQQIVLKENYLLRMFFAPMFHFVKQDVVMTKVLESMIKMF